MVALGRAPINWWGGNKMYVGTPLCLQDLLHAVREDVPLLWREGSHPWLLWLPPRKSVVSWQEPRGKKILDSFLPFLHDKGNEWMVSVGSKIRRSKHFSTFVLSSYMCTFAYLCLNTGQNCMSFRLSYSRHTYKRHMQNMSCFLFQNAYCTVSCHTDLYIPNPT